MNGVRVTLHRLGCRCRLMPTCLSGPASAWSRIGVSFASTVCGSRAGRQASHSHSHCSVEPVLLVGLRSCWSAADVLGMKTRPVSWNCAGISLQHAGHRQRNDLVAARRHRSEHSRPWPTLRMRPTGSALPKYLRAVLSDSTMDSGCESTCAGSPATSGSLMTLKKFGSDRPASSRKTGGRRR